MKSLLFFFFICVICVGAVPNFTIYEREFFPGSFQGFHPLTFGKSFLTLEDIYKKPLFIFTRAEGPKEFHAYLIPEGLSSVPKIPNLYKYLNSDMEKKGLLLSPKDTLFSSQGLLPSEAVVSQMFLPEGLQLSKMGKLLATPLPLLWVMDAEEFGKDLPNYNFIEIAEFNILPEELKLVKNFVPFASFPVSLPNQGHYPFNPFPNQGYYPFNPFYNPFFY